jgi:hypothetical protein
MLNKRDQEQWKNDPNSSKVCKTNDKVRFTNYIVQFNTLESNKQY